MLSPDSDQLRLSAQGADKPSSSTTGISRFALQGPLHPGADASGYGNCTKSRKEQICNFDETDHVRPPHASSVTQVSGRQNGSLPLRIASEMSRGSELLRENASNSLCCVAMILLFHAALPIAVSANLRLLASLMVR
jgi:hypothetical protein